ncbi:phosphoserine phosphatase SerB [Marinomonas agarivorans]|nr:phosphoserine phosphatase SerB [Marinomonas agarivorans]
MNVSALTAFLQDYDLTFTRRPLTKPEEKICVERWNLSQAFTAEQEVNVRQTLLQFSDRDGVDYVYQQKSVDLQQPGLAVFDMDSTLIKAEVIDELAVEAGIGEQIAAITASAMRGELDFNASFTQRLSLLAGLSSERMDAVFDRINYMDGIEKMMKVLNHFQWHTAILSGGFTFFAQKIQERFGFSEVHANVLEIKEGKLTGKHLGEIVNAQRKKQLLLDIMAQQKITAEQTVACGDGANDLLMLNTAKLGVALHAKPLVRQNAPHPVNQLGLESVLYLAGMTSQEITEILL